MSDQVKVTLVIDDEGSVKVLRTAASESDKTGHKFDELDKKVKGLGKSFGGLKSLVGAGLGALGVGGVAFGIKDVVEKTGELAEETHKFHSITGLGSKSSLDYVAALNARGIGAQAAGNAFGFLAKNIQTAERQEYSYGVAAGKAALKGKTATGLLGVQAMAFRTLGIEARTFSKLSPEKQLELITKKFEALPPGAEKTRLELQLMGKGAKALSPVLEKGALSLNNMTKMAQKYFPTIKGGAHAEEELILRQTESKLAWEGLQYTLGTLLVPAVTSVESWFSKMIFQLEHGHGIWGTFKRDGEAAAAVLKNVWKWLGSNKGAANDLIFVLKILAAAWAVEKVVAFVNALRSLTVIEGAVKLIRLLTAGDLLLTVQVGFLDAAAGVGAFAASAALALAPIAALYGAVKLLDKVLPEGSRPENLLGGNQPGEKLKEGTPAVRAYAQRHRGVAHPSEEVRRGREQFLASVHSSSEGVEAANQLKALAHEEHTTKVDLHIDGHKFAEAIAKNPRAARMLAESGVHVGLKYAARR